MRTCTLPNGETTSVLGIGGHYRHFEYGIFEETYGPVEPTEVESRAKLIARAISCGVCYFDTTWYNEVEMLSKTLAITGGRDQIHINGMVLGAFPGSAHCNMTERDYVSRYLDKRLAILPGHRFDSFMINAIEEGYDAARCESLVKLLLERKHSGDIGMIGFSCHNHDIARRVADTFPDFELIMTAYNFKNRAFERAFDGYRGSAAFVAMKPMVWAEYGIPFSAINNLPNFEAHFGAAPDPEVGIKALRFLANNPRVDVAVCAVNTESELDALLSAGEGDTDESELDSLARYQQLIEQDDSAPLFLGALNTGNTRGEFFAASNLCRLLGIEHGDLCVKDEDRGEILGRYKQRIQVALRGSAYEKYLCNL